MSSHGRCGDALTKPSLKKPTSNKNYDCNANISFIYRSIIHNYAQDPLNLLREDWRVDSMVMFGGHRHGRFVVAVGGADAPD
jgi:hypothetical protein